MKERIIRLYDIKIHQLLEVKKLGKGVYKYFLKMFIVDIRDVSGRTMFGVKVDKDYSKSLRRVFRRIQESMHLIKKNRR